MHSHLRAWVTVWLLASSCATGCAEHRLPAIDPTGQRIFSGTTTLAKHDWLHGGLFHHKQQPATAPAVVPVQPAVPVVPVKPPCTPPVAVVAPAPQPLVAVPLVPVVPANCGNNQVPPIVLPGKNQAGGAAACPSPSGPELKVTPARLVAPVNTEVVLAAGICGPDGYYITKQPLEWMLAQDGAGQIVAVGHESPHNVSYLLRQSPQKVATNYARAHTSTISQVLDRGTPSRADDVYLHKGQSWISITSPTEGTSHVVVWAPKEQNWERRMATATIFWVDAAWRFPPCATARAGGRQTLTTVVTRSGGQPLAGWIVRYEILEGPPATFSARGNTATEVITDAAGRATAELLPRSLEPGITTVKVQVIRPAAARGDLPQMVVGQGMTSVQWTTPGLAVRALGSASVTADGAIGYRVEVTNSGDLVTRGVTLSYTPPAGVAVLNSTPAAQQFGERFEWRLGDLAPRTTAVVEINCRASVTASVRSVFRATSADGLVAEHAVATEVRTNALSVRMTGPEAVEVGQEARFQVDVTNIGTTPLSNVTATDTFESGLAHRGGEASPIVRTLARPLEPGQTDRFAVSFIVTQPGQHCHRLVVTADGGQVAVARACVTGTQPTVAPPRLSVRVSGSPSQRAGETAEFVVEVQNAGGQPAANVVLTVNWGINLALEQATQDHEDDLTRRTTRWRIAQLQPGETIRRRLICRCLNADEQGASVRATVTSQQTGAISQEARTVILPPAANPAVPPARAPTPPAGAPATAIPPAGTPAAPSAPGNLTVTVGPLANPIAAGATTTFLVNITNDRPVPDRDLAVSLEVVGDGLAITRPAGTTPTPVATTGPAAVDFQPLREIRPGEQLRPYAIEVRGVRPGTHRLRVTVTSGLVPGGLRAEGIVTVNP